MIQKQEEKLLIELYRRYYQGEREPITELALGESLNLSYKQLHEASSFWIQKGCVKTFSKRGGQSAYIITDMGLIEAEHLVVKRGQLIRNIIVGGVIVVFLIIMGFAF